ncbi:uncharacterized protein [Eurosta solidaginis]|uniref:uncharacterized protein n=1 Tax=Eurosta solidaginis TaxID=178769 RepID=UPI0035314331
MPDETVKFVQLVKTYPYLYNSLLPEYSQKEVTDRAWSEIAQQMTWLANDCKEKWRSIRNAYARSLRPYSNGTSTKSKKPYYLREAMDFMLPYMNPTNPITHSESTVNITLADSNEQYFGENVELLENAEDQNATVPLGTLKRHNDTPIITEVKMLKTIFNETNEPNQTVIQGFQENKDKKTPADTSKMFLLSLLPDLKNLSDKRVREFKILTMLLLEELITEQEKEIEDKCFRRPLPPQSSNSQVSTSAGSSTHVTTTQNKDKEFVGNTFIVPAKAESTTPERQVHLLSHQQPVQVQMHQQPSQGMSHQQPVQVLSQLQSTPNIWKGVLCYHNNSNRN